MITATAMTHVGLVRERNEDSLVLPGLVSFGSLPGPLAVRYPPSAGPLTFAVVDGMGGHRGGQVASRLVAQHLADNATAGAVEVLADANRLLYAEMQRTPHLTGMGATIAGALLASGTATIFNVGDARVYQFCGDYLMLLSTDDRVRPGSNVVTQSLGGSDRPANIEPHIREISLGDEQRLLICSDGLSEAVDFSSIETVLAEMSTEKATVTLLQAALQAGAADNVSLIILDCVEEGLRYDS